MGKNNAKMLDLETYFQAGINPKTGLPLKFGNRRCSTKEDIKKIIRKNDEQIFVNRYVWHNIPCDLTSQDIERMLYYRGQICFFYLPELDQFFFMPYALNGTIDVYGRFNSIIPVPESSGSKERDKNVTNYFSQKKLNVKYGVVLPERLKEEDLYNSAVIIWDYTKQLSQTIIPTQQLNDGLIDLESECVPYLRNVMLTGSGVQGIRVADADQQSVEEGSRNMIDYALHAMPFVPIVGTLEMQNLTEGSTVACADYLQTMQALDNFRLGTHGVPNGGLFDKSEYVNNMQTNMNLGGADVSLTLEDGLKQRQHACNVINSIWGLGTWCEISENIVNTDLDNDGLAYDRDEGENGGVEDDTNV